MTNSTTKTSRRIAIKRFGTPSAAEKYSSDLVCTATDRREQRCVRRALASVRPGARVLDLPCGTGRLLPLLVELGYKVTAADSSPHMLDRARHLAETNSLDMSNEDFLVVDVFQTGFADDAFDVVVCNRLFHHFTEPATRQRALRELRRICTGPIVVSVFCNLAYDALISRIKHILFRRAAADRIAIGFKTFAKDIHAAGLIVRAKILSRPLISRQWYVVLHRGQNPAETAT